MYVYDIKQRHITEEMIILIRDLYPDAFRVLTEMYSKSKLNHDFYEFKIVHRFIRCNFGEYDSLSEDVGKGGVFNFEDVKCPLRGECMYEGLICKSRMKTKLTKREQQVAELLASGYTRQEIAEELSISPYTVVRHIMSIKARLHLRNSQQIIQHFNGRE